jgi:putative phage-type endonuclease
MLIHNFTQQSPEWFAVRKLKLTASKAQAIAAQGKGLSTLCLELVAGYLSKANEAEKQNYSNEHTERGNKLESHARFLYSLDCTAPIKEVGFIEYSQFVGCSPDGLVGDDGLIEIKCMADKGHCEQLVSGASGIDSAHIWQMQMQMLITDRKWCDYVCYNPNFEKRLLVYRINEDKEKHEKLLKGFDAGAVIIKDLLKRAE